MAEEYEPTNDLGKYFAALSERQRYYIKGVVNQPIDELLSLNEENFDKQLRDSLTIGELAQLSDRDIEDANKLIVETLEVWRSHKHRHEHEHTNSNKKTAEMDASDGDDNDNDSDSESPSEILLDLVSKANITFFKDQYNTAHASVNIHDHAEILRVEGSKFKRYLTKLYYDSEEKVIGSETVKNVISILQARAEFEGQTYPLSLRVAWYEGDIYYDLTNDRWQCVRITKDGWELLDKTPIPMFTRYNQIPQVVPAASGDYEPDVFDMFLRLTNLKNEEDKILAAVYIITLFIPDIPHVVSQIHGEKGSAKSTLQTFIKLLVDPAKPKQLTIRHDISEFIQQLAHNYISFYDNLKYTPSWLSDEVCKAVTGVGSTKRKLYSDDDDIVYEYKRCIGFNGINLGLTEPDIFDRSIMVELERITKEDRKQEADIITEFLELRPKLLSYIFDISVKALKIKPTIKLNDLPRMADFAIWGEAIARAMGYKELEFISVYYDNIGKQNVEAVENNPLGQAIAKLIESFFDKDKPSSWQASLSKALNVLNTIALENNINTGSKMWPKAENSLSKRLKPLLSNLREGLGFEIEIVRITSGNQKTKGRRSLRVWKKPSPLSPSSPDQFHEGIQGKNGDSSLDGDSSNRYQDLISSPKYPKSQEIHVQNRIGDSSDGSDGFCDTEGGGSYNCYHNGCSFSTDIELEYQSHGVLNHSSNPLLYPSKAEIEQYGLKPQGKEWEI
jgi:hypothetical protein